jgi:hypothetical protein
MIWESQSVIQAIELERNPPTVTVNRRQWLRLPAPLQANIAVSSYCRLGAVERDAEMQVVDTVGSLLGTVHGGIWKNRLTGD